MAQRVKTIEFPFLTNNASLAANTKLNFTTQTIYIPENTSRTFRSVWLQISYRGQETTATSHAASTLGITLGAAGENTTAAFTPAVNSGEQQNLVLFRDVTSYFTTNFGAGTSQTVACSFQLATVATTNHNAKLIITYEWSDTSQDTRIKTVKIPLESATTAPTTSLVEIGTNQVPALDTFLVESSKTIRYIWFECYFNENAAAATDNQLSLACDSEAAANDAVHENALISACSGVRNYIRRYYNSSGTLTEPHGSFATDTTHAFKWAYVSASGFRHMGIVLCVTYEYSHTSSTSILNSIQLATNFHNYPGATTSSDYSFTKTNFFIEEANISLVQSGILFSYANQSTYSVYVKCGSQSTYRTYTDSGSAYCGSCFMTHRIDSGSQYGAGITLARGLNSLSVYAYASSLGLFGLNGLLMLNYTSDKDASGDAVHNHTVHWGLHTSQGAASVNVVVDSAAAYVNIPETDYFLTSITVVSNSNQITVGNMVHVETTTGIFDEDGYFPVFIDPHGNDGETGWFLKWQNTLFHSTDKNTFKQYSTDLNKGFDVEGSYRWCYSNISAANHVYSLLTTYHCITQTVAGTVSGYADEDGAGLTVEIYRSDTDEKIGSVTTTSGGAFTFTWYDDTVDLYATCIEDSTHVGMSYTGTAS